MEAREKSSAEILLEFGIELDPVIEAYKKDVDRTLLRRNLNLTIEERFAELMELQKFAEELQRAGTRMR